MSETQQIRNKVMMQAMDHRVRIFLHDGLALDSESWRKIEHLLTLSDIAHLVVLPDVHSKPDNPIPTGIVTLTNDTIYPFAIGQEIGCGLRLLRTTLSAQDVGQEYQIDGIFNNIKMLLRDGKRQKPLFTRKIYDRILRGGPEWISEAPAHVQHYIPKTHNLIQSFISDRSLQIRHMRATIPSDAYRGGLSRLGCLGGGNHFVEMQRIDKIFDKQLAKSLDLQQGQIVFMMHTGSTVFSKRLDNFYGIRYQQQRWDKRLRKNFRKSLYHFSDMNMMRLAARLGLFFQKDFRGIPAQSIEGKRYQMAHQAALNYAYVNRSLISGFIMHALKKNIHHAFDMDVLSDVMHERIDREVVDGKGYWIHRNGASRIIPSVDPAHQVLCVPGCLGGTSFICIANEAVKDTFYSVNHGAGRCFTKQQARKKFDRNDIVSSLHQKNIRLYKMSREDIREQAPQAFKDINTVIESMRHHNLVTPVASVFPLAILKG